MWRCCLIMKQMFQLISLVKCKRCTTVLSHLILVYHAEMNTSWLIDYIDWVDRERVYLGLPLDMYISYPTIEPHYLPHYTIVICGMSRFIKPFTIQNKGFVSAQLFWPGSRQFLGGQLHTYACTQHLGGHICMWGSKQLCVYRSLRNVILAVCHIQNAPFCVFRYAHI